LGRRPLGAILHSSNEPGELSQWLCHDDSTINIVVIIIIIIFSPSVDIFRRDLLLLLLCRIGSIASFVGTNSGCIFCDA